jgi:hypothetical protein
MIIKCLVASDTGTDANTDMSRHGVHFLLACGWLLLPAGQAWECTTCHCLDNILKPDRLGGGCSGMQGSLPV